MDLFLNLIICLLIADICDCTTFETAAVIIVIVAGDGDHGPHNGWAVGLLISCYGEASEKNELISSLLEHSEKFFVANFNVNGLK